MDYLGDLFTVTEPDAPVLHCWMLINAVPRLKEIAAYLEQMLHPLEKVIENWGTLTDEEIDTIINYIIDGDFEGLLDWLKTRFPSEPPSELEAALQEFLYGYYNLAVGKANTLAIEIVAEEYLTLPAGMKIQYKTSREATEATIYTLGETYQLYHWEERVFDDGEYVWQVWVELYYKDITEDVDTWQYARAIAEAFKESKYGATIAITYCTFFGDNETFYEVAFEDTFWATIGSRRETFLPEPNHYYDHYVNASLVHVTDPVTRGGIYGAYFTEDWEYHTDDPLTMGTPWAGDAGERPYNDDLYNWINVTVNPPGFTDLEHQFLLTMKCRHVFYGYGKDPGADPKPKIPTSPVAGLFGGVLGGAVPPLAMIFKPLFGKDQD